MDRPKNGMVLNNKNVRPGLAVDQIWIARGAKGKKSGRDGEIRVYSGLPDRDKLEPYSDRHGSAGMMLISDQ